MAIINTDKRTFLIKFQFQVSERKFLFNTGLELMELLKTKDKNGIEYIKEFNYTKNTFNRVSKKDLLKVFSWDTEAIQYFKKHYYFK